MTTNWSQHSTRKLRRELHRWQRALWNWADAGYGPESGAADNELGNFRAIHAELKRRGEFVG